MLSSKPTSKDIDSARQHGEACVMKCADTHMPLIPKLMAKYRASLDTCS